jgi:NOL1/NOP2/fmu family ribosome biogenesis protein
MLSAWITDPGELVFIRHKDSVLGLPENTYAVLRELDGLFILKAGILIGALIRYEIVPAHALAISTVISLSVESVQFSREEALQYLRRAELINATDKRGWIIVKYGTLNIGFIKSMGNRINNYYPKEWRILNK